MLENSLEFFLNEGIYPVNVRHDMAETGLDDHPDILTGILPELIIEYITNIPCHEIAKWYPCKWKKWMAVEHQLSASFRTVAEPRYYLRNSVTANQRPKCSLPRSSVFCLLTFHFSLLTSHFSPLPFAFCLFTSKPVPLVDVGPHNFHNAILPFYEISDPFTHSVQFGTAPPAAGRFLHRSGGYTCTRFSPLQSVHPAAIRTG